MSEAVLAIRSRALGDLVLLTPALRALRRGYPGAAIEVVTEARYAPILECVEGVTHTWRFERSFAGTAGLVRRLRRRRYALAVDFFGNPRSAFITAASGARHTAGFDVRHRGAAYHVRAPRALPLPPGRREYTAAAHLRLAEAAGGKADGLETRLTLTPQARADGERLLATAGVDDPGRTIGLVAAGTWPTKTWPVAHAARLARDLMAHGYPILLLTGPREERVTQAMADLAPGVRILPPCGLLELAGVIARLGALVGTDSGPRHVAAALGVPTFGWFGPTHPESWTPPDPRHGTWQTPLPCRACERTRCPHWCCMPGLTSDTARTLVLAHLEAHGPAPALGPPARA